jgi:FdhE protein
MPVPSITQTRKPDWGKRIERAIDLAEQHPSTAEILTFYRRILDLQQTLYGIASSRPAPAVSGKNAFLEQLDLDFAMRQLPALLSLVRKAGPSKLAQEAAGMAHASSSEQRQVLHEFVDKPDGMDNTPKSFFARVLFQPLAEYLAAQMPSPEGFSGSICPICGARPLVAVLRPEGNGGKRFLICSLCLTEGEFRRILCPVCGEESHTKLPRYTAEGVSAVRVEACDTCHYYLKSVDMTVDGLAVPLVDDVATTPLDVWATGHGYKKISLNLMGF